MNRSLLDTDILSEVLKGRNARVAGSAREYLREFGTFTLSVLSWLELVKGYHRVGREDALDRVRVRLQPHALLDFDAASAELAGRVFADLERAGLPIGRVDPMIAATALRHGLILVSGNRSHYEHVVQVGYPLRLCNWRD